VVVIENIANTFALAFDEILRCPLMLDVVALMLVIKFEILFDASSNSCKNKELAELSAVVLNLAPPAAMPVEFVVVEYV
jgi:hypothetical protein